jgi:hypothetical protein
MFEIFAKFSKFRNFVKLFPKCENFEIFVFRYYITKPDNFEIFGFRKSIFRNYFLEFRNKIFEFFKNIDLNFKKNISKFRFGKIDLTILKFILLNFK